MQGKPHSMPRRVRAVLGPTNTGKTHYALERMLAHSSGIIGFPLRLLARENYDRMVAAKGAASVALITGEEKIVPPNARWFSCTTEAMPLDRHAEFVAVDEIQLSADPDRGHVFTDRLLHARGLVETLFLGAETIRPLLQRLVPGIEIDTRPRLSNLVGVGHIKLSKLPARSAIVAFSAAEVYAIAEIIRRRRGGCAIIMGQLSPRTRNAQVQLYQNKEVDYLVATDAIGMGLNMDVNHVALASLTKFDGTTIRPLLAQEIAQIAGRAGRGMRDGTFGTTAEARPMSEALIEAVEEHRFDPLERLSWRNSDLDFSNPQALLASLNRPPPKSGLTAGRVASDLATLEALTAEADVRRAVTGRKATRLLWDVCQIPDFRKLGDDSHTRLCHRLFFHILQDGVVPANWLEGHISGFARTDGDIDTLMHRLSGVRVCSYVAARSEWSHNAREWQERARKVEDMISDALHERLTARFVDRRATSLLRRLDSDGDRQFLSAVTQSGDVIVEGHAVGRVEGFALQPLDDSPGPEQRLMLKAARRALLQEIPRRVQSLAEAPDEALRLDLQSGHIAWSGVLVGKLVKGRGVLHPETQVLRGEFTDAKQRDQVKERLQAFCQEEIGRTLAPLFAARDASAGIPLLRGILHRLEEHGGVMPLSTEDRTLPPQSRAHLRRLGISVGREAIYLPALLKPAAMALRALLLSVHTQTPLVETDASRVSIIHERSNVLAALGWRWSGPIWLRLDVAEKLAAELAQLTRRGDRPAPANLSSRCGVAGAALPELLKALRIPFRTAQILEAGQFGPCTPLMIRQAQLHRQPRGQAKKATTKRAHAAPRRPVSPDNPFAALAALRMRAPH
ncbi:DNA helicase [Kozakia baliensis NRIC 0488]|nr:DNA helicase [Kozakia baliensis NRIC 0488]GEL63519.1 hypothetical protein KBA01_08050 [Kozakia baliensis]